MSDSLEDRLDRMELTPGMEPLTPEEKEAFLARVRAQGRTLTSEEQYALFGPPPEPKPAAPVDEEVEEMEAADLDEDRLGRLTADFFPELGGRTGVPAHRLIAGVILDFDDTLASLTRPPDELLDEGARNAEAYMRSTGMDLPPDFNANIIEARRFALEKSDEEKEEHIADDAMSFLLQFFGYPASHLPWLRCWLPGGHFLRTGDDGVGAAPRRVRCWTPCADGFRLALMTNYSAVRLPAHGRLSGHPRLFRHLHQQRRRQFRKPAFLQLALDRWGNHAVRSGRGRRQPAPRHRRPAWSWARSRCR
ncbi:MAG: hypothetical protein R2854_24205 [Caldilineaceae bacterium]